MNDPQVKQKLADQGLTVAGDTPEHFRDYIGAETQKWATVIKDAGLETGKWLGVFRSVNAAQICADVPPVAVRAWAAT